MPGGHLKRPGEHSVIQHAPALHPTRHPATEDAPGPSKRKKSSDQVRGRNAPFLPSIGSDSNRSHMNTAHRSLARRFCFADSSSSPASPCLSSTLQGTRHPQNRLFGIRFTRTKALPGRFPKHRSSRLEKHAECLETQISIFVLSRQQHKKGACSFYPGHLFKSRVK